MSSNQKLKVTLAFQKYQKVKQTLIDTISFLIPKFYFTIGNLMLKQEIGILMGLGPAPYWAGLFLYFFESKFVQQLISKGSEHAFKFQRTSRFIDELCAVNDYGEFSSSWKFIYPKQLELELEDQGIHATFLDLDITNEDNMFLCKLFGKRDKFHFFIVCMLYPLSNIPSIFYSSIFSEFLQIAWYTRRLTDFVPKASQLYTRIVTQGANNASILHQMKKAFQKYPETFCIELCKTWPNNKKNNYVLTWKLQLGWQKLYTETSKIKFSGRRVFHRTKVEKGAPLVVT